MNNKKTFQDNLLNLMEEEILSKTDADLLELYNADNLDSIEDFKSTQSLIDKALTEHKKRKLITARKELQVEQANTQRPTSTKTRNAKDFIIDLMLSNRLPEGLTLAFREGEDISDEEIEGIIEDLRDLGIDFDDE
ncbi:MAG: hypothetical protein QM500_10180 [Methylococcales bacterium]